MEKVKLYNSIIDTNIQHKLPEAGWCTDLVQYATYKCGIEGMISTAFLFCPEIVEVKGYIFIKQFFNCAEGKELEYLKSLEEQYQYNKKDIEMSVNSCSIGDFFVGDTRELMDDDDIISQFAHALVYFWKCRVRDLFPERNIVVELGYELMGELGLSITLYEDTSSHTGRNGI
ncbi:MAG: hypothetical protein K2O32_07960 [Acetatifactor sp.]|nr:hypothetical protein [Acetatifactor sp.]